MLVSFLNEQVLALNTRILHDSLGRCHITLHFSDHSQRYREEDHHIGYNLQLESQEVVAQVSSFSGYCKDGDRQGEKYADEVKCKAHPPVEGVECEGHVTALF